MSFRFIIVIGLLIFLGGIIVNAADNQNHLDAVTNHLVLAQEPTAESLRDGEMIVAKLKSTGAAADVRVVYAKSLFWLAHGKYDQPLDVLNGLDEESQQSLPLQRIRLWLAVQRRDREEAEQVLNRLAKLVLQPTMGESARQLSEKSATAEFLGGMLGYLEQYGNESMNILPERSREKIDALSNCLRSEWSQALRLEAQRVITRGVELARLRDEFSEMAAETKRAALLEAEQLLSTCTTAILEASIGLDRTKSETQKSREENTRMRDEWISKHRMLALDWKQETPGKPAIPRQPRRPSPPETTEKVRELQPNVKYETVSRKVSDTKDPNYHRKLREYEVAITNYLLAMAAYPDRLAAWQDADRQRRAKINEAEREVQKEIREVNQGISQLGKPIATAVSEHRERVEELALAKVRLQLWRALANGSIAPNKLLFDLNHFALLDMEQEMQRITVSLKK